MGSLRFLLAMTVLFTHALGGGLIGGRFAVEAFFVISGYLMSYILVEAKTYTSKKKFYVNRILRLYPLYYLVILCSLPVQFIAYKYFNENNQFAAYAVMPISGVVLLIILNIILVGQDQLMFMSVDNGKFAWNGNYSAGNVELYRGLIAPQTWTLGVEILFYIVAPFILMKRRLIFVLIACSAILRILFIMMGFGLKDPWVYRFFPTELLFFLLGAISHQVISKYISRLRISLKNVLTRIIALIIAVFFILFPYFENQYIVRDILLFSVLVLSLPFLFEFQQKNKLDNYFGQLSYPIYLWHLLIITIIGGASEKFQLGYYFRIYSIVAVTLGLSIISVRFVDEFVAKYRKMNKH